MRDIFIVFLMVLFLFLIFIRLDDSGFFAKEFSPSTGINSKPSFSCALKRTFEAKDSNNKLGSLTDLAALYNKQGDMETYRQMLSEALRIARLENDRIDRAVAIREIAKIGEAEDLEKCLLIARTIKYNPELSERTLVFEELAENFSRLGRNDRAKAVLEELYSNSLKSENREGPQDISALKYVKAGFCLQTLMPGMIQKGGFDSKNAACFASTGQAEQAFSVANKLRGYKKFDALLNMAEVFRKTANRSQTLRALAKALKIIHHTNEFIDYESRTRALTEIGNAYIKIGEAEKGLKMLEEAAIPAETIASPVFRAEAIANLAVGFAEAHSFERAVREWTKIDSSETFRTKFLIEIAAKMFKAGSSDLGLQTLNKAAQLPEQWFSTYVLTAEVYADNDYRREALNFLEKGEIAFPNRPSGDNQEALYFDKILSIYLKFGEYDRAMAFALKTHDYSAIARVEIETNKSRASFNEQTEKLLTEFGCLE